MSTIIGLNNKAFPQTELEIQSSYTTNYWKFYVYMMLVHEFHELTTCICVYIYILLNWKDSREKILKNT